MKAESFLPLFRDEDSSPKAPMLTKNHQMRAERQHYRTMTAPPAACWQFAVQFAAQKSVHPPQPFPARPGPAPGPPPFRQDSLV